MGGFCHRKGFFESDPGNLFCFSEAGSRTLTQAASLIRASEVNQKKKEEGWATPATQCNFVWLSQMHVSSNDGERGSAERPWWQHRG